MSGQPSREGGGCEGHSERRAGPRLGKPRCKALSAGALAVTAHLLLERGPVGLQKEMVPENRRGCKLAYREERGKGLSVLP